MPLGGTPSSFRDMSMGTKKLSALVVAHNEEDYLEDCLASLAFADDVVVVLDRCTDRSKEIAERAGVNLIEGAWEIEGERRNLGIQACKGDWIVEVDADERVTDALAAEIRTHIETAAPGVYAIPVRNFIGEKEVVHGWGAYIGVNSANRLFTPGEKRWGMQRVHPSIELSGASGRLTQGLIHLVDRDLAETFSRVNRYTTLAARDAVADNSDPSLFKAFRHLFSRSWKVFVHRRGYKEGVYGLTLAMCAGAYTLQTYVKCKEIRRTMAKKVTAK